MGKPLSFLKIFLVSIEKLWRNFMCSVRLKETSESDLILELHEFPVEPRKEKYLISLEKVVFYNSKTIERPSLLHIYIEWNSRIASHTAKVIDLKLLFFQLFFFFFSLIW